MTQPNLRVDTYMNAISNSTDHTLKCLKMSNSMHLTLSNSNVMVHLMMSKSNAKIHLKMSNVV